MKMNGGIQLTDGWQRLTLTFTIPRINGIVKFNYTKIILIQQNLQKIVLLSTIGIIIIKLENILKENLIF